MLKVLSIKQPWADMVVKAKKPTEIRSRDTNYRGPLYIHASKTIDTDAAEKFKLDPAKLRTGQIIGKVELTKTFKYASKEEFEKDQQNHLNEPEWYEEPRYGWIFEKPEEFEKGYPLKGQLGIFEITSLEKIDLKTLPIIKKKLKDLKPAPYNPRKTSKAFKDKLKSSIAKFGYVQLIVWNEKTGHIVGGHQGVDILKELKGNDYEVEVRKVDISLEEEKALNLALNKIGADWDEDKLIEVLGDIDKKSEDLLVNTGFDDKELEILLDQIKDPFEEAKEDKITIDDIKETQIKPGDVFEINGKHRIGCLDSTKNDALKGLFGARKADLMVTSPPYNAKINYSEYNDNKELNEYLGLIEGVYKNIKDFMANHRFLCINVGDQTKINLSAHHSIILEKLFYKYQRTVYWVKPEGAARATIRVPYPRWYKPKVNTESMLIYLNSDDIEPDPEFLKVMLVYTDKEMSSKDKPVTKEIKRIEPKLMKKYAANVWKLTPETRMGAHPAPFPIELPGLCIKFYSLENELIFDPFLGAGTTILAAEREKRIGYGCDLDPRYIELSLRRFKQKHQGAEIKCLNRKLNLNL